MKEYLDFDLEIREGGPQKYPVVVDSPGGQAQEEMRFPFDDYELENKLLALENALLRSGGSRRGLSSEEQTVRDFGERLFRAVLVGDVRTRFEVSLREAQRNNKGLRLKLRIKPPKLALLPWEFLYDSERGEYLCFSSNTPLVRFVDLRQPIEQLPVTPPLRILGLVVSPTDLPRLDVEHEKRRVEEATKVLRERGLVELEWLEAQTWSALQEAMWGGPWHIFHFVGHGDFDRSSGEGRVAFSDEVGRHVILPARNLARLLDDHLTLRLAFLNSCEGAKGSEGDPFSGTAATLVRRGVPAVVAMQYEITDKSAIEFSRAFYHAVANNLPVDSAVAAARTAVSMYDTLEWGTPVLYMRSPDGRLFDIQKEDEGGGEPLRRYREAVQTSLISGELQEPEVERLEDIAVTELGLNPQTATDIEREVMGESKETRFQRQEHEKQVTAMFEQGQRFLADREWLQALRCFEVVNRLQPDLPDAWVSKGTALDNLGRNEEAIRAYDRALSIKPDFPLAWSNRGIALANLGRNEEAIEAQDRALSINPDSPDAWVSKGAALGNLGRNEEAIRAYDRALDLKPDFPLARSNKDIAQRNLRRGKGFFRKMSGL